MRYNSINKMNNMLRTLIYSILGRESSLSKDSGHDFLFLYLIKSLFILQINFYDSIFYIISFQIIEMTNFMDNSRQFEAFGRDESDRNFNHSNTR